MNTYPNQFYERPLEIEMIREMAGSTVLTARQKRELAEKAVEIDGDDGEAFIIRQAATWLDEGRNEPEAAKLFGSFWHEGELCILFADTNAGKSVLAVQIGDSISRGEPIAPFAMGAQPATVLYYDFELTARQFVSRYTGGAYGVYSFSPKFLRAVINPGSTRERKFKKYEDYIIHSLENNLVSTRAKVLIVDNITCLRHGTHAAAGAASLMRSLQEIKVKYGLSVLVLAHTPKRNLARAITRNDLQGSKMLINFCDSAFAIGESQAEPGLRYLKQIKQRNNAEEYGAANVCLCRLDKPFNFLRFAFTGHSPESGHLLHYTQQQRLAREGRVMHLHRQGHSNRQVAAELNISSTSVQRVINRVRREGEEEKTS